MNIQRMTTKLRPRKTWEAVDLGFTMARQWFLPLWGLWLLLALPVFILASVALPHSTYWSVFIVWWLKPLFEQAVLYYLSQSLFGEYPSFQHIRKQLWPIIKPQLWQSLSFRRLSLARSFNQPVAMLEQLKGQRRSKRLEVLHHNQRNVSQWLTIVSVHLETTLYLSLFAALLVLIPEEQDFFDWADFLEGNNLPLQYLANISYFIGISLIAPFYVAAGFALYLTRRTELEAWDIELSFKKLSQRQKAQQGKSLLSVMATSLLTASALFSASYSTPSHAIDKASAKASIKEVMQREPFGKIEYYETWQPKQKEAEEIDAEWLEKIKAFFESLFDGAQWIGDASPLIANVFKALLWISLGLLCAYLIWRFTHWLDWLGLPQFKPSQIKRPPLPSTLFGLEVNADSLPADVIGEAEKLIQQQQWRAALALLYRASLIQLIHLHQLDIPESATEGECQRLVRQQRPDPESIFFTRLTRQWLLLAYAHEHPQAGELKALCQQWPQYYAQQDPGQSQ